MEERRIVTVLFCDVAGSTALAGRLDAEDWAEIISAAFPLLIDPVERFGGIVARLMGDAILAFFGAPTAREDDPQRAILAALDILEGMATYRVQVRAVYGLDINVRVGINTGIAVTGEFGSRGASEYTAMGDTVNIAARMEQTAEPGTIQITAATHRLARGYFEFEPLGPVEVKGKEEPVESYRVLGRASDPVRERIAPDVSISMVGRERELDLLRYKLGELRHGRSGVVALIGEPGLGKSRLLAELRQTWLEQRDHHPDAWVEDWLVSFEASTPYGLLHRRLAHDLHIDDGASAVAISNQLEEILGPLVGVERERTVQAIAQLFGADQRVGPPAAGGELEGVEDFRHELGMATERLWRTRAERVGRCVYVIDDFHCADAASVELFERLLPNLLDLPLLVVLAFRPERESPAWAFHERLSTELGIRYLSISLAPLEERDTLALVEMLLPGARLPAAFRRMMLERIDGNPLFAEEIVRSLIERDIIEPDALGERRQWRIAADADLAAVELPTTLHALVQERMDRLDAGTKRTLQLAAVLGRTFTQRELRVVANEPDMLDAQLAALQRAMLVRPDRYAGGDSYMFHHALVWEAAYQSILRRDRRRLHLRVGEELERMHAATLDAYAGLLALHFAEAGDERAIAYATQAGDRAFVLYAAAEAAEHYSRAVSVAQRLNAPPLPVRLLRRRGRSYLTLGEYERAREDFEATLERARIAHDRTGEWQALTDIGDLWQGVDYGRSGEWRTRTLALAESIGDETLIATSLASLGNWYTNLERIDEARDALIRAAAIFEQQGDQRNKARVLDLLGTLEALAGDIVSTVRYWREAAAIFEEHGELIRLSSALTCIVISRGTYVFETMVCPTDFSLSEALDLSRRSLELARLTGWRSGEAFALISLGMVAGWHGEYRLALEAIADGVQVAHEIEHLEWITRGHTTHATLLADLFVDGPVIEELERALQYASRSGSGHRYAITAAILVSAYTRAGKLEQAAELLVRVDSDEPLNSIGRRRIRLARAELALASGRPKAALEAIADLYESAANLAHPGEIPRLALLRGEALLELGSYDEAMRSFNEALAGAQEREIQPLLWRIHALRAAALGLAGRTEDIEQEREQARRIVRRLGDELVDDSLRDHFLTHAAAVIDAGWQSPRPRLGSELPA